MSTPSRSAILVWALVALGAAFWGSRIPFAAPENPVSNDAQAGNAPPLSTGAWLPGDSTLAATTAAGQSQPVASRFQLSGVVAPTRVDGSGIALIAVDGQRAGAYVVGATVDGDVVLQSISSRGATLMSTNGAVVIVLELPAPTASAIGVLHAAAADAESTPAVDLVLEAPRRSQGSSNALSAGRRQRLRGLGTAPTDTQPAVR